MVKACIDPIAEWNKPNARLRRSDVLQRTEKRSLIETAM